MSRTVCLNRINVISGGSSPYEVIKHVRNRLEMIYKNREQTRHDSAKFEMMSLNIILACKTNQIFILLNIL